MSSKMNPAWIECKQPASRMGAQRRRAMSRSTCVLAACLAASLCTCAANAGAASDQTSPAHAKVNLARLPLRFEANAGQANPETRYLARGAGYQIAMTRSGAALMLRKNRNDADVIRLEPTSATASDPVGELQLPGVTNYLIGKNPSGWRVGVTGFGAIRYPQLYPGVDLVYHGNGGQLEFDFVLAPHADAGAIGLRASGARGVRITPAGELLIETAGGEVAFHRPVVYQVEGGNRIGVEGAFRLAADGTIHFALGSYDHSRELVIDPTLEYSTYLGNNSWDITAIAVDSSGNAYVTGQATSADFPVTPGSISSTFLENTAFVTKMNPSGTALIYSTFLGGSGTSYGDSGAAIAVDAAGEAYVTGTTYAANFPVTTGAYQSKNAAVSGESTTFFAKLNASGTALLYSTFLGGSITDRATGLTIDSKLNAYVSGFAYSSDFPTTTGVLQKTNKSLAHDGWNAFVSKINPAASGAASLVYSTYLGGSDENTPPSGAQIRIAVDSTGDAYIGSSVNSTDYPVTTSAYQSTNRGAAVGGGSNLAISELNPTATKLLYSTYLGGSGAGYRGDTAGGFAISSSGNIFLAGSTWETNFPVTKGAFQSTNKTGGNVASTCFVARLNPAASGVASLVYSTYLGGSGGFSGDAANSVAVDASGDAYVTGTTPSSDFPVTSNAFQGALNPNAATFNQANAFFTELNPTGTALKYSTYFGGNGSDVGTGVSVTSTGNVYLAGYTNSANFPVTKDSYQTVFNAPGLATGWIAEFVMGTPPTTAQSVTTLIANANPAVNGTGVIFTAGVSAATGTSIPTGSVVFTLDEGSTVTVPLNGTGSATWNAGDLLYGKHYILASYTGATTWAASGDGVVETIVPDRPTISPPGGVYPSAQFVTIASPVKGATIYFTTDGSEPTSSSSVYSAPLLVSTGETVRAIAIIPGIPSSSVATASYTPIGAPTVLAAQAANIESTQATLNALADTYGMAGSYYFQYGTVKTQLTSSTKSMPLNGSAFGSRLVFVPIPVSEVLTGLASGTTYYFRVLVTTPAGVSRGTILSFTTP